MNIFLEISYEPLYSRQLSNKTTPYFEKRPHNEFLILKLGQRKLLFNELELYTMFKKKNINENPLVIYAGAAAGIHSTIFGELFPHWEFHFYDKNKFSTDLTKYPNIKLFNQYFTEKECSIYSGEQRKIIFLSDIRSGSSNEAVEKDMEMQKNWCKIIKPNFCMLKFRLPWKPGKTSYFRPSSNTNNTYGIYTQPRIGPTSTEMRLIFEYDNNDWKQNHEIDYDNNYYNDQCFFFQRHQRCAFHLIDNFEELSLEIKGLCHCNDCWSELEICKNYLNSSSPKDLISLMKLIELHSKSNLDQSPHNLLVNETNINKKKRILAPITIKYFNKLLENFD